MTPSPPPHEPQELARLVRTARETAGLSQQDVADAADVSRSLVQQIESGRRRDGSPAHPRSKSILAVARVLGLDELEALRLAGRPAPATPKHRLTVSEQKLVDTMSRLPAHVQTAIVVIAQSIGDDATAAPRKGAAA